jgi:hypothetical protein
VLETSIAVPVKKTVPSRFQDGKDDKEREEEQSRREEEEAGGEIARLEGTAKSLQERLFGRTPKLQILRALRSWNRCLQLKSMGFSHRWGTNTFGVRRLSQAPYNY